MYKLSTDDSGLNCGEDGLTYGGLPLLTKSTTGRFEPCPADRLHKIGIAASPSGLKAIALALNENDLTRAMIGALHLKLPPIDTAIAAKLAKAGYRDDEPRDDHGRWTAEDSDDSDDDESSSSPSDNSNGYQLAAANVNETPEQRRAKEERFVDAHYAETEVIAKQLNVPVENILGAAAKESSWGTSPAAVDLDNYFGLHSPAPFENPQKKRKAKNSNAYIAGFDSYNDSLKSFAAVSGTKIADLDNPIEFANALQGKKFGIHEDGSPVSSYVSTLAATIKSVYSITASRKL